MGLSNFDFTRSRGRLMVDGAEVSRHLDEKEAIEAGLNAIQGGATEADFHPGILRIRATRDEPAPAPDPIPDPDPDPEPEPEPDPTPDPDPIPDPTPEPGEILRVRWTNGLGTSDTALTDGGKGTTDTGGGVLEIVDGASVGLPAGMGNALGIRNVQNWGHVLFPNLFPVPAAGQVWELSYVVWQEAGQTNTKWHPMCLNPIGNIQAVHLAIDARHGNGAWTPWPLFSWDGLPFGAHAWENGAMMVVQPDEKIRYTCELRWQSGSTFTTHMRIDNMDGTLRSDDFRNVDNANQSAQGQLARISDPSLARTPSWGMGQAGSSGQRYFVADISVKLG